MSLLFLDSFDHYTDLDVKWDAQFFGSNIVATQSYGRFTPGALQVTAAGGGGSRDKTLPLSAELIAGFAWNNINADTYLGKIAFLDDQSNVAELLITPSTGVATLTYNGQVATTAPSLFTGATWHHVEFRVKQHASLGELEIRLNGLTVASVTGVNTLPASVTGLNTFRVTATNNSQVHLLDDLYIVDTLGATNNTFVGDSRITVLRPKANGLTTNFTPTGAGTNWQATDDTVHDGDSTFVEAGQLGAKDQYDNTDFADLGITPGTIYGVQVVNSAKKTDAGQLKYLDQMVVGGLTYDNGTEIIATGGTYKMTRFIRDTDPSDNAAWTEAKVAAVGSGFEITFREV